MVAVLVLDSSKRCRFLNAVAEVLTGESQQAAAGKPLQTLLGRDNPDAFRESALGRVLESGTQGEGEIVFTDGQGSRRPLSFRVFPVAISDDAPGATVVELVDLSGETGTGRALRESEQRLRLAVESTGIGIWDVNVISGRRNWSPEFLAILGLPPETIPSRSLFVSLIHPDDRFEADASYHRAYAERSEAPYSAEFRIRRASDGVERWVATTGKITFDVEGRPIRGIGTLRDIHDRRTSEEALREREQRLQVALFAGRMGTWRKDLITGEQQWDAMQYQVLGVDPSQPPSRALFRSLVHPDDLKSVDFKISDLSPADYVDSEFRIRSPSGEIRWIRGNAMIRTDERGRPTDIVGVNFDVTAQKEAERALRESEERHRLAIESNEIGTWDYDLATGRHLWSDQFKRLLGLKAETAEDPKLMRPLEGPADWAAIVDAWIGSADPEGPGRVSGEYQIRRGDTGDRRWCSVVGRVFFDADSRKPVRAIGILSDVTGRKATETRRRHEVMEIHHRVRNNLAVVQALLAQTLRATAKGEEMFKLIQPRLMAMARVHDSLARSEAGEIPLSALVEQQLEAYRPRIMLSGEMVILDSAVALGLGMALHELATNAHAFGGLSSDTGRIDISWVLSQAAIPELAIVWQEHGGPRVKAQARPRLGMRLIESSIAGIGGKVASNFKGEGAEWRLTMPLPTAAPELAAY